MKKMKAYVRIAAANQDVQLAEVPIPEVGDDEVLVKVEAFGVGIHDRYFIPQGISFPYIIGSEGAGVIAECGSKVSDFKNGDRVLFTTVLQPQGGCWAEYAVAKQSSLIPLPDNLSFAQGAAVPIAGKTALECMRDLDLKKNDKLFIAGASGAIGTFVIQLASSKGIHISASASERNHEYMKSLGADKTVDYQDPNWVSQVKEWSENGGVNAALAIQPGTGADSIKVVKDGGKLITVSGDNAHVVPEREIKVEQMGHNTDRQALVNFVEAISKSAVEVVLEKEYPFDKALEALEKTETRRARGKLIVKGLN